MYEKLPDTLTMETWQKQIDEWQKTWDETQIKILEMNKAIEVDVDKDIENFKNKELKG